MCLSNSSGHETMEKKIKSRERKGSRSLGTSIAKRVALVAGVLAGVLSVLMIANFIQLKSVDPLNSQAVAVLMGRLQESPQDAALKDQIRALDLLARKAYFTYLWQIRTGGYLLFSFILVLVLALKYMSSAEPRLPDLSRGPEPAGGPEKKILSRRYLLYSGFGLFLLALVLGFLSQTELEKIGAPKAGKGGGGFPGIEEIKNNWPGFRGPQGIGVSYSTGIPVEWDGPSGHNIVWKIPVPLPGPNSPIIWGDKIFFSGADRESQAVYCVDPESGEFFWEAELNDVAGSPEGRPRVSEDTGFAAPTMTTDGKRVFALFATGDIGCFDFDGKRLWSKNLGVPENHYGHASSLITYRDLLLIQYDQLSGGHLLALGTASGDLVYDQAREVEISWASPILVDTGNRTELILNANPFIISHDPRTGRELWRVECMMGEIAPSPSYADGMVFAVNDYARLVGIKLDETPEISWEYIDDLSEVSSPLATEDYLFMAASFGALSCFDSKTGERLWVEDFKDGFYSSPVLVGENVYLMDFEGVMYIFKADKEYKLVGSNELGEGAVTIPAFKDNRIFIRGDRHLFCIGK